MHLRVTTRIVILLLAVMPLLPGAATIAAEPQRPTVYILPITGAIELGLSGFLRRAVAEARSADAQAIILEIDTFGGRVDAAVEICKILSDAKPLRTIAYVTNQAWSAGALIALACDEIVMAPGSSIGSAEPRLGIGTGQETTDEKSTSAVRAKFRAVAEEHGHNPHLAEAMVDQDVELRLAQIRGADRILMPEEIEQLRNQLPDREINVVRTISAKGKLLNLAAGEAHELGLATAVLPDRQALLGHLGLADARIVELTPNWSEWLVRAVTHPIVSSLLLSLGMLGIFIELRTPGFGAPGLLGLACIALFFWGHHLIGLANWTEILLFAAGVVLLGIEVFALPGFGLVGAAGIILMLVALFLALVKHPVVLPQVEFARAFYTISYAFIATVLLGALSLRVAPRTALWQRFVLNAREERTAGYSSDVAALTSLASKTGRALTSLRPSGRAQIGAAIVDVVTEGDFIDAGSSIRVVRVEGNRVIVAANAAEVPTIGGA